MSKGPRGRFITLEGGEGVGKSTQLAALARELRARGRNVVVSREPGGSAGAEAIRELLLHHPADAWSPQTEALLFAAARSDHVARVIRPALARGDWLICDRYIDSSRAYQGGAGGLDDAAVMALHAIGSDGLLPDRTLLLNISAQEAEKRREGRILDRSDRFEDRPANYHDEVRSAFIAMAEKEPERFRIINADADAATVTGRLLAALDDMLCT